MILRGAKTTTLGVNPDKHFYLDSYVFVMDRIKNERVRRKTIFSALNVL
jgi:hypothetical protein